MKAINIHGKPYIMVKDRVTHFNSEYPNGCIKTTLKDKTDNMVIFEACVIPNVEHLDRYFTGHAEEEIGSSQINNTSALENCETSAVGRALAMMGIGVDESFASADEVANAITQQNEVELTGMPLPSETQNTLKSAENGLVCPLCSKSVVDKRVEDIDGKLICPKSKNGKNLPAFHCIDNNDIKNPKCKFASWKIDVGDAGVMVEEVAPHQKELVKEENLPEAEELAQQEEEVLPF